MSNLGPIYLMDFLTRQSCQVFGFHLGECYPASETKPIPNKCRRTTGLRMVDPLAHPYTCHLVHCHIRDYVKER